MIAFRIFRGIFIIAAVALLGWGIYEPHHNREAAIVAVIFATVYFLQLGSIFDLKERVAKLEEALKEKNLKS